VATATEEDEEDTVGGLVACVFDVTAGECSPSDYQDGTSAYCFDLPVVPAVEVAVRSANLGSTSSWKRRSPVRTRSRHRCSSH
jgi:hypothetical protein